MSDKGSIDVEVELIGCEGIRGASALKDEADRFAEARRGWHPSRRGDEVRLDYSTDHAARIEEEMAWLAGELSHLAVPPEGWVARVSYTSHEHDGDGGMVWLIVSGGRIARYEESVVAFVGKEPPFTFDMNRGERPGALQVTVEKALRVGLDVPAGDFDGACDWVARNLGEVDFGEGTAFAVSVLEDGGSRERVVFEGVE